ncbi:MAG: hypothetical protein AAF738_09165, partial [Bacteroidota bacterium]
LGFNMKAIAQQEDECATDYLLEEQIKLNPELKQQLNKQRNKVQQHIHEHKTSNTNKTASLTITIPDSISCST